MGLPQKSKLDGKSIKDQVLTYIKNTIKAIYYILGGPVGHRSTIFPHKVYAYKKIEKELC